MSHLPFADPHANRTLLPDDVAATAPTDSDHPSHARPIVNDKTGAEAPV